MFVVPQFNSHFSFPKFKYIKVDSPKYHKLHPKDRKHFIYMV